LPSGKPKEQQSKQRAAEAARHTPP
jgi:hypothetical protein